MESPKQQSDLSQYSDAYAVIDAQNYLGTDISDDYGKDFQGKFELRVSKIKRKYSDEALKAINVVVNKTEKPFEKFIFYNVGLLELSCSRFLLINDKDKLIGTLGKLETLEQMIPIFPLEFFISRKITKVLYEIDALEEAINQLDETIKNTVTHNPFQTPAYYPTDGLSDCQPVTSEIESETYDIKNGIIIIGKKLADIIRGNNKSAKGKPENIFINARRFYSEITDKKGENTKPL